MVVHERVSRRWLHPPLVALGLLGLVGVVIVALLVGTILIHALVLTAVGVPFQELVDTLSISQVLGDMAEDLFAWMAGIILFIGLLPVVARYNDWLRRVLYDQGREGETES